MTEKKKKKQYPGIHHPVTNIKFLVYSLTFFKAKFISCDQKHVSSVCFLIYNMRSYMFLFATLVAANIYL